MPLAVIAIGGNALARAEEEGTIEQQFTNARTTCAKLVTFLEEGWDIVLTHGNGPQVGNMLWRAELAAQQVHPVDLGICDANSQGQIGYMLQQVLGHELSARNVSRSVVTLVTQVEVSAEDPALRDPRKPVGPFFTEEQAQRKMKEEGWNMREDSGRGWRRLVPSPKPLSIIEVDAVRTLVRNGFVPIAVGGGGIPVVRGVNSCFDGIEAVVDKDLSASLLARRLAANLLIICTAVPYVSLNFGTPQEKALHEVDVATLAGYLADGEFPAGSMGPKIEACVEFVRGGGVGSRRRAIITDMDNLKDALAGRAGTIISL